MSLRTIGIPWYAEVFGMVWLQVLFTGVTGVLLVWLMLLGIRAAFEAYRRYHHISLL